jgi:hypothetical protein
MCHHSKAPSNGVGSFKKSVLVCALRGLFAPNLVFYLVALILTDALICLASLLYSDLLEDETRGSDN